MNTIYDEHKKVYRVNNSDGTFDTYTPEQYRALSVDEVVEEEVVEEEVETIEDETKTDVQDTLIENEDADVVLETPSELTTDDALVGPNSTLPVNTTDDTSITNEANPQA